MEHARKTSKPIFIITGIVVVVVIILLIVYLFGMWSNGIYTTSEGKMDSFQMGKSLIGEKKYDEAVKYFKKAVQSDPDSREYIKELAVAQYNTEDYKGAIKSYEKMIKDDAGDAFAYNGIANAYRDLGDELAAQFYQKAIEANPEYTVAYNNYAQVLIEQGKKEEAKQILTDGIKANPDSEDLQKALDNLS